MESLHSQKEQLCLQSNNRQTYADPKQIYGYFLMDGKKIKIHIKDQEYL